MNQHFALIKLDFWEENVFVFIIAFKVHIVIFFFKCIFKKKLIFFKWLIISHYRYLQNVKKHSCLFPKDLYIVLKRDQLKLSWAVLWCNTNL